MWSTDSKSRRSGIRGAEVSRYLVALASLVAMICLGVGTATAAQDCTLGAQYLTLAKARLSAHAEEAAATFLANSIAACPTYDAYETLGELSAKSEDTAKEQQAAQAFAKAYDLANENGERAHTLYEYASFLDSRGDPQNANPLIVRAAALDGSDPQIRRLAAQIESEVQHPTSAGIVRGLKDSLYVPLRLASASESAAAPDEDTPTSDSGSAPVGPSVNIPINFETNSTVVDAQTQANIAKLSGALRSQEFRDRHFLFIGYADVRGSEPHNVELSRARAQTVYQMLLTLDPTLAGRVEVIGRGAVDPIDPAHNEAAYRRNRRLQVLLKAND